jgi:GNAT superfamily N-acetyltransferase
MAPRTWKAEPSEAEIVARLMIGFRNDLGEDWPSDNAFLAGVEQLIEDPNTEYILGAASDDSPPAGVVQLRFRWGLWRAGVDCLLEDLFVESSARGTGLGRALVAESMRRARDRGARRMELDCNEANTVAQQLYASLGFVHSRPSRYGGARNLFLRVHLDDGPELP